MALPDLIDDETATRYWSERDTAPEAERESRNAALIDWAKAKKADQFRVEQEQAESAYADLDGWWKENGAGHVFEKDEDRLEVANRRFIANQYQQTPDQQGRYYPTYRDEYLQKTFGKSGLSETETFNLIRDSLTARKETEAALRELPGALAKGMFSKIGEGMDFDETDSWHLFQDWKDRHADKLGKLPEGWESAMLDRAVKLQARSETMMRDLAPESKRAFDTLMAFTRPEDAEALPEAGRADVENIAKEFAKLTPEDRQNIYSTLYYAAEADGAGMGKGFFEKIGEGIARGGVNIYNDAEMTAQDRQARQNISEFQSLLDKPEQQPDRMQTAQSIQLQRDLAQKGVEENTQRLAELKALREIRQIADGTIDPIKTEMDGVMGEIVQGAYDYAPSVAYMGLAAVPFVGFPATMGAMTNSNYLRMLDAFPDMDADAALGISAAVSAPMAFIERLQGRALIGKSPKFNALMKKMTDVRIPIAGRLAIGYGANVGVQTVQEWAQEAMPVAADQLAAAIREDMPEFDAEKAWGAYREQMPEIFYSMLWGGLIGTGASTFREFKRNGQFERSLGELEMQGVTGEAAQDIAAEQDLDVANTKFREAWGKRTPEDIQAGIAKRAAQLEAARSTQQNPELPVRRIEENADGTLTHIIEKPDGTVLYRTNDSDAADTAFVNITGMVGRSQLTGTTRGIVESLQFIDQVNQAAGRGEDVQKLLIDDAPRNLLDEYEANPTEQNLNNLFETVRSQGQDINEPAELANFPVLASNQGALVDGVFRSIIKIQDGATGDKVMRDFSQDNLKRAIAEGRITMDWVRENLNQVIPLIDSERNTGPALRTETDTDVIESFSDVAVAYMTGRIREEQIPAGFRGFLRRMAIIVKDIFRRAYRLKRAIAEGKVDSNFEGFLAESVGLNQQTMVDTTRERASGELTQGTFNYSIGPMSDAVGLKTYDEAVRAGNDAELFELNKTIAGEDFAQKAQKAKDETKRLQNILIKRYGKKDAERNPGGRLIKDAIYEASMLSRKPVPIFDEVLAKNAANAAKAGFAIDTNFNSTPKEIFDTLIQFPKNQATIKVVSDDVIFDIFGEEGWAQYQDGMVISDHEMGRALPREFKAFLVGTKNGYEAAVYGKELNKVIQSRAKITGVHRVVGDKKDFARQIAGGESEPLFDASTKLIQDDDQIFYLGDIKEKDIEIIDSPEFVSINDEISSRNREQILKENNFNELPFIDFEIRNQPQVLQAAESKLKEEASKGWPWLDDKNSPYSNHNFTDANGNKWVLEFNDYLDPSSKDFKRLYEYSLTLNGRQVAKVVSDQFNESRLLDSQIKEVFKSLNPDWYYVAKQPQTPAPGATNYSIGKKQDADYLAAVERGDMETAQRMVDEAAKAAGYNVGPVWRGAKFGGGIADRSSQVKWFTDYKPEAESYGGGEILESVYLKGEIREGDFQSVAITPETQLRKDEDIILTRIAQAIQTPKQRREMNGGRPVRRHFALLNPNQIKSADPVTRDEQGNVIPLSERFDQTTGNINYSIGKKQSAGGIRFDEITKEDPKHDGSRVGTAWQGKVKPTTQQTNDGIATIKPNELEKQMAMLTQFVDGVPLPKFITKFKDAQKRMRAFIDFQKGNLLALYDAFDALSSDYVIRSTHWYDGARLLAEGVRDNYRLTIEQSSAIISVFSPMKDWFQNVAMGQRFADVMANHKNKKITKATMGGAMREMLDAAEDDRKIRKAFKQIEGRSISQLLKDKSKEGRTIAAVAVRLMSTNVHGLTHDVLSPEGESLGTRKNLDGTNKKLVWQSYTFIEKAISIYEDGSAKNISKVLGTEHKIRNFYNNIVAPTSPFGDATVDTHAVNAAVLYPMGNKGYLVGLNFGNAGVAGGGNSGIYWLFHEALREAAKERGVMPRQMQSITWEAIRGLFTDIRKRDKNFVAGITKIWETSSNADAARTQIIGLGITPPEWARVGSSYSGGEGGMRSSTGQVADSAGSVQSGIRQGRQGGDRRAGVNYSIASQSEIDRVNRALGGMNRGPDERLKVYERARQKFSKLMAWNSDELGAMADTGSDETQIRRNQLLQGFGELDAILDVLPPEVRGRVGGYTVLANIAPMDVFKDGVKISETKNMAGAIISAWMKEGQNIGQAGKQVSLPPGYTAKENLASKRADKALADFFRDRIKRIDTELEKVLVREYTEAITKAVKQSRPKAGDNNVRKSTLGPETQKLADLVQRATMMDEDAVAERMLQLEQTMATSENSADMVEEWGILNQFGDLKNRNSETLAQAYGWFKDQLKLGREAWRIKEEARIAENRERAKNTVAFIGKASRSDDFKNKTFMDRVSDWANSALLDHASFEQFVMALLPPDVAADFSTRLRKADVAAQKAEIDQREGILNALREGAKAAGITHGKAIVMLKTEVPSAVRYLDDRNVKNTKLTIEQAEKIVRGEIDRSDLSDADVRNLADELAALPADTRKENITIRQVVYPGKEVRLPMTRGKAIQLLLSWNQPDVQDKMRREGWTDDSITDLRELTSDPVSQAMISHAQELYGQGAGIVNPVYSRMFGMNMPQVKNYAPTRFKHSKDVKDIGLDGSPVATGTTPSFAKSRVSHSSEIAAEDALSVMQQHILMQAHWVNFAELAREYRSLINNPKVRDAIKNKHGEGVLKIAEQWADQMEQRGGNQAREAKWVSDILGSVIGGQSVASLGFNLKSIAMQLDNALRFGLALDKKQIASAMSSPDQLIKDIKTVFESDALQTRLRGGATAETRYMFERFGGKPGTAAKVTELSMKPMNWMDVSSFSFSAAIVYRANLNEAMEAGMPESLARETALDAAAAAIYRFSQPVSFGQKSNVENSGNMYTKAFFLFMSDPRLKAAIMADAVRGLATGRGDKWTHIRRLVAVELMAVLSHVVASSYRDAFTDDEDDDIWSYGGWVRAIALAPLQGYLFIGTMLDNVLSQLTGAGFFTPTQNPLISVAQSGLRALKNADDILAFDDPDALFKEWIAIARTMAVAPAAAMPAVLLNLVKPIFGAADNATTED